MADRITFASSPKFEARRYISDPLVRAVFADPRWAEKPAGCRERPPRVQVCGARSEVLKLLAKWDRAGCLWLVPARRSEERRRCWLFAVPKDEARLRQILKSLPENARVFGYSEATSKLASA